tara:strand:+ start:292 stop:1071 length:780 start_codon:yes stop_codon:yes gene_type:complete
MKILRGFINIPTGQIHYRQCGVGKPILLLHMTPGSSLIYEQCLHLLAEAGYKAIAMDTPGYGDSDSIGENQTIQDYSQAVSLLIEQLELQTVDLVGLSTGSVIAANTAITFEQMVNKLVLIEPGIFNTPDRQKSGYHGVKIELDQDGEYFLKRWKQISNGFGGNLNDEQAFVLFLDALRSHQHQHEAYQALIYYDLMNDLPKINQSTLLITGSLSTRKEPMSTFYKKLQDASICELSDVANAAPLENPKKFVEALLNWL